MKIERRTDLNSVVTTGIYYYSVRSKIKNTPAGKEDTPGFLFVSEQDEGIIFQVLISFGNLFSRQRIDYEKWTPWINLSAGVEAYVLPVASDTEIGGVKIGRGMSITDDGELVVDTYELPISSATKIGGVKIGRNLSITKNGVLSAADPIKYILPIASSTELGGVKIGKNIKITKDGVIFVEFPEKEKIKIGNTLEISDDGKINISTEILKKINTKLQKNSNAKIVEKVDDKKNELPVASSTELGGIKIKENDNYLYIADGNFLEFDDKKILDQVPKEKQKVFTYKIHDADVTFVWTLENQINFLSKVNVALMYQVGVLSGIGEKISISDGNDNYYELTVSELLDLFINGYLE